MDEQYSYIDAAKNRGYNILLMDGQLDVAMISMLEQKFEKSRFTRVDSDVIDRLIAKEEHKEANLESNQREILSSVFRSQLPQIKKVEFNVETQSLGENGAPIMITQSEYMRRMKEMANIQAGMSFYGEMPNMYNLVLNADHKLVKQVLTDAGNSCKAALEPIESEMANLNNRRKELQKAQEGKKTEDIPQAEKDELNDIEKKHLFYDSKTILQELLQKDYKKYLAEIIIDGYTDTDGDYDYNLELSQKRSLAVAQYLTEIRENFLSSDEISELQNYLTVNGHGSANPVLDSDGNVDKDASRRVEVKFRLKDDEMINELNQIMNTDKTSDSEKSGSN